MTISIAGLTRKLYDWVLHWAHTPYGGIALFLLAFAESSFFPIPPDVLLIALIIGAADKPPLQLPLIDFKNNSLSKNISLLLSYLKDITLLLIKNIFSLTKTFPLSKAAKYAFVCSIASVVGGCFGYSIGHYLWYNGGEYSSIADFFFNHIPGFNEILFDKLKLKYATYGFWIVFTAGFTPIPYKLITITAGVCNINIFIFIIASAISRSARFFMVSFILWIFGSKIKNFIDKYFNLLSILFLVLLILGFIVLKYIFH